jgi:hypothetical protein
LLLGASSCNPLDCTYKSIFKAKWSHSLLTRYAYKLAQRIMVVIYNCKYYIAFTYIKFTSIHQKGAKHKLPLTRIQKNH